MESDLVFMDTRSNPAEFSDTLPTFDSQLLIGLLSLYSQPLESLASDLVLKVQSDKIIPVESFFMARILVLTPVHLKQETTLESI